MCHQQGAAVPVLEMLYEFLLSNLLSSNPPPLGATLTPAVFVFPQNSWPDFTGAALWVTASETSALSKALASVPPLLLRPSWSLNVNGTLISRWNYSFWVTQKPGKNMEWNKNESWQQTGIIIIPGAFLDWLPGNTQHLNSIAGVLQCPPAAQRQNNETAGEAQDRTEPGLRNQTLGCTLLSQCGGGSQGVGGFPSLLLLHLLTILLLKVNK